MVRVLIRGSNDVGSAIAHRLINTGCIVLIHDVAAPAVPRRRMAFCDALFDGEAALCGVAARRVEDLSQLATWPQIVAICSLEFDQVLRVWRPDVMIDARMRKRSIPDIQRHLAPLVIGVGPNFTVGPQAHLVVESSYGETLGQVITSGSSRPFAGEPRAILGHSRDRFIYAAHAGVLCTRREIGEVVCAGDLLAHLDQTECRAPLDGAIRGMVRDGVPVTQGTKIIEIDPRGTAAQLSGIAERPRKIAEGVLEAMRSTSMTAGHSRSPSARIT